MNETGHDHELPRLQIAIRSIQVGGIESFKTGDDAAKPWHSAINKMSVTGPIELTELGLDGDDQADRKHHGGPDKAILTYPQAHLDHWQVEFPEIPWDGGSFGENLTLVGATEAHVCVGDVFESDDCALQISQPREPCWKLSRRWGLPKLAVRVAATRRTGWYCRVLRGGHLASGQTLTLVRRPHPQWTIAAANDVMFAKPHDPSESARLVQCESLSEAWKVTLRRR